jgi:hypothetical protein
MKVTVLFADLLSSLYEAIAEMHRWASVGMLQIESLKFHGRIEWHGRPPVNHAQDSRATITAIQQRGKPASPMLQPRLSK